MARGPARSWPMGTPSSSHAVMLTSERTMLRTPRPLKGAQLVARPFLDAGGPASGRQESRGGSSGAAPDGRQRVSYDVLQGILLSIPASIIPASPPAPAPSPPQPPPREPPKEHVQRRYGCACEAGWGAGWGFGAPRPPGPKTANRSPKAHGRTRRRVHTADRPRSRATTATTNSSGRTGLLTCLPSLHGPSTMAYPL